MKCCQHPDRWPDHGIDNGKLNLIVTCPECLEVLEYRILLEIDSGDIPSVSADFSDRVMDKVMDKTAEKFAPVLSTGTSSFQQTPQRTANKQIATDKRLTFLHYITAAAATIALVLTGSFNTIFQSGPGYGDTINRFAKNMTTKASTGIPVNKEWSKNLEKNIERYRSNLQKEVKKHVER